METTIARVIADISVEDLSEVERDLNYTQLVSLGFLLFGDDRVNGQFVLQKLLVLSNGSRSRGAQRGNDLLRKYTQVNKNNWRSCLVEALTIIGARRVLRKLGFEWRAVHQHYLPHITELSIHIHPVLKTLYQICERLTPTQAGKMIIYVNENHKQIEQHLRFYDFQYLEVFMLDWISHNIISIGDYAMKGANVDVLLSYFKLAEMPGLKSLLLDTMNANAEQSTVNTNMTMADETSNEAVNQQTETKPTSDTKSKSQTDATSAAAEGAPCLAIVLENLTISNRTCERDPDECYLVRYESAGIVVIINQRSFYEAQESEFKELLPKMKLGERRGTDKDKEALREAFSSFGYNVEEHDNLSHLKLLHVVRETVKRAAMYDSLIVCILSHGADGAVYGNNSIPVKIATLEEIIAASTLEGKPKMLVIQACQKDESPIVTKKTNCTQPFRYVDIIKAMSTLPGYLSIRHIDDGTWFIQSLCNSVQEYGDKRHMQDILMRVTRDVASKRGEKNEAMLPQTTITLRKCFYLPSRK